MHDPEPSRAAGLFECQPGEDEPARPEVQHGTVRLSDPRHLLAEFNRVAIAFLALPQCRLDLLAVRDVLDDGNEAGGRAVLAADERDGQQGPDGAAVPGQVALLNPV